MSADKHFLLRTRIARPAQDVFAWHERPGALERLCPPWETVELVASTGGIRDGARVTVRQKFGPWWLNWQVEHRDYVAGRQFRDVQISGPFARWEHFHQIEPDGPEACWLTDEIVYRLPGGVIGQTMGGGITHRRLTRLFEWRHATTKGDQELTEPAQGSSRRVLIAGASGLIGRTLVPFLKTQGCTVVRLVRRKPAAGDEVCWNPAAGELDLGAAGTVDAIINLSGENLAGGRWTEARRDAIFRSRVDATRTLVSAMQKLQPKPEVFVSASAVGFYGDRGAEILTEESGIGHGFLPEVCLAWETHAEGARRAGVRTALMRFGVVLTPAGGALAKLLPVFRAGIGGTVGGGQQWMSWIGIDDAVSAMHHAIHDPLCSGPMNIVSPQPVTNREFTRVLARVLCRPAVFPVPAVALRALFGGMAEETLLASCRAIPEKLRERGYRFRYADLEEALRHTSGLAAGEAND